MVRVSIQSVPLRASDADYFTWCSGVDRGSGTANFPYLISPLEAIQGRCRTDLTDVSWFADDWDLQTAGTVSQFQDVAIVFVNSDSGEGESATFFTVRWLFEHEN